MPLIAIVLALLVAVPAHAKPNFTSTFAGRDGCFVLYDLKESRVIARFNPKEYSSKRISPCSTFKVPLALMAFDASILKDETSAMKWDGVKTPREEWNRDQTAASWMRNSVVWFSQRLTPQLEMEKVKAHLSRFRYGNEDMSGGLTKAWLQSSLLISPDEQLRFWERFWREDLPVSKHAFDMTKKITLIDTSRSGWTLHGKTGSGAIAARDGKSFRGLGWFAGHVARGDREYVFVTSYTDRAQASDERPPGWIAREMSKRILREMGLY